MGRPKGSKNKVHSGITYPRKCEYCDYISNNPSMYHYHKKTHDKIPNGQMCDKGCGQLAKFKNIRGSYLCSSSIHQCPAYLSNHSERVKKEWQRPEAASRKERTRETFFEHCCGKDEVIAKMKETKRKQFGNMTPSEAKDFRSYARRIRSRAQQWAKEQGYEIGQRTYHVDHKLSIFDAWQANLPAEVVNHPENLQVIEAKENESKGPTSILTVEELLRIINESWSLCI